jgi:esterase/lipase superfamily enzyme
MNNFRRITTVLILVFTLFSCRTVKPNQLKKMPPPAVLNDEKYNPFINGAVILNRKRLPILYATNRTPSQEGDNEPYYNSTRSEVVRMGIAGIGVAEEDLTWDDMSMINKGQKSSSKPLLEVLDVKEFGILDTSLSPFSSKEMREEQTVLAKERFLIELRSQLRQTESKDVFIFVHGYNVNFENPLLVSAQLWHYIGYRGSFISYGWPATPRGTAYMKDLDTASMSTRSLRVFLDFLAQQDEIKRIHILGYSAGTRLVIQTLYEKALELKEIPAKEAQLKTKLGTVILSNSDMDRGLFGTYLMDGELNILEKLDLYTSSKDLVLKGAQIYHSSIPRMGQTFTEREMTPAIRDYFNVEEKLKIIDVSNAEKVTTNGGHFYFLESPWVSSDVLFNLWTGNEPVERGLVRDENLPLWVFPPDYIERSRSILDEMIQNREIENSQ